MQDLWFTSDKKTRTSRYGRGLRWRAVYVDGSGGEHTKAFRTKADAQGWLDDTTAAVVSGTWVDPRKGKERFDVVAEQWLLSKGGLKPKTTAGYRGLLDTLVLPRWEDELLDSIDFKSVQTWVNGLSATGGGNRFVDRGLSPSRVRQAHQLFSAVLKFAVKSGLLVRNPAEGVELPRVVDAEQVYLNHGQLQSLAEECGRFQSLILVLGYCGLRFGEAIALRVGDVDLEKARIRVRRSVTHVAGRGMLEGPTKNHAARTVPVPLVALDPLRSRIGKRSNAELVWAPLGETQWTTLGAVRWVFDPAVRRCASRSNDFPMLTPHHLRHTCASLAISAGANVKVLQTLLGHKTATMTLDRYGHLMPDDLDAVSVAMDAAARQAAYRLRTGDIPADRDEARNSLDQQR